MKQPIEIAVHAWENGGCTIYITLPENCNAQVKENVRHERDPGYETEPVVRATEPDDEGFLYDNLD